MSMSHEHRRFHHVALVTLLLLSAAPACDDTGEPTGSEGTGASGATGGGGAGGSGGTGAEGGAGGGGTGGCLPESAYASLFTLGPSDLCAVAVYTADTVVAYQQPTWGAHGGPLLLSAGPGTGEITLARWTAPSGSEGAMTVAKTTIGAKLPDGAFVGGEALDLGYRPGTLIAYTNAFPDTSGEVIVVNGSSADERYGVNGFFSAAVLPDGASGGRLLHTSLSPLNADAAVNGLYAADDCDGSFVPGGSACGDPQQIAAWGDASGPVVVDAQGNVLVLMSSFAGTQEARWFAASEIAKGGAASSGVPLFIAEGFGLSLAAIGPTDAGEGIAAFQPSDASSFEALDVLHVRYSVDSGALTASDPAPLLALKTANTPVALFADPAGRLWAGVSNLDSGGNAVSTTFVVLARKAE